MRFHDTFNSLSLIAAILCCWSFVQVSGSVTITSSFAVRPAPLSLKKTAASTKFSNGYKTNKPLFMATTVDSTSNGETDRTLYEILGASPKDSPRALKLKYTALAKKLHPDSSGFVGEEEKSLATAEFTRVVEAWRVLADPKERLKYDRSLKAKEIAGNVESFIDFGVRVGVPFIQKTAEVSTQTMNKTAVGFGNAFDDATYRLGKAAERREVDKKTRQLEQQAGKDMSLAMNIKKEIDTISSKRLSTLKNPRVEDMTSVEALRILGEFQKYQYMKQSKKKESPSNQLNVYIESLKEMEQEYSNKMMEKQNVENVLNNAELNVENALIAERLAKQRLENKRAKLEESRRIMDAYRRERFEAIQKEKDGLTDLETLASALRKRQEKARGTATSGIGFRTTNVIPSKEEDAYLQRLYQQLDESVKTLRSKAQAVTDADLTIAKTSRNEELAKQEFEDARQAAEIEAPQNVGVSEAQKMKAKENERILLNELENLLGSLRRRQERVCSSLKNREDECIEKEKIYLQAEYEQLVNSSRSTQAEAEEWKRKSEQLQREVKEYEKNKK